LKIHSTDLRHMITVIIHFLVRPEAIEQFRQNTQENVADRRQAIGNLQTQFFQQENDLQRFVLLEQFDNQKNIDDYYTTSSYQRWHQAVNPLLLAIEGNDFIVH
ncbi:MAG: antibiotic biosynthesis monooxygenase, partial [Bacteroidota bacterium]